LVHVIGLNSGSSFDGMDAVLVDIELAPDGYPGRPTYIDGLSHDWPKEVGERVLASFQNQVDIFEMTRLNYEAGAVYAEAARELMRKNNLAPEDVFVIGFDGQTVYQEAPDHTLMKKEVGDSLVALWHDAGYGAGFQIGEQSIVTAVTDVPVVSVFRPMDHALGGTGAPLMQFLDFCAFRDIGPVMTLNIGGIANCQLANADRSKMMAFDTGPGNVMIDQAMRDLYGREYDANGEIAASGTVDAEMLAELKNHPFFSRPVPRSAWRLDFAGDYTTGLLKKYSALPKEDLVATFTEFTGYAITRSISDNVPGFGGVREIIASGGGVRNAVLMVSLAEHMREHGVEVVTSDKYGIPPQYKEAIKFATLAFANMHGIANNIPAASGASKYAILGKLTKPPRMAKI
jgi:anhydro-N-acetylmuramic acid kinase